MKRNPLQLYTKRIFLLLFFEGYAGKQGNASSGVIGDLYLIDT